MTVYRLESRVQAYDWGSATAISECLGRKPRGGPEAELWMGAHPRCPSPLSSSCGDSANLLQLIERDPTAALGADILSTFGSLPFLFKVLAAAEPLSLQAHPNMAQAKDGFAHEEVARVPLSAGHRNYKDASHKPELIYALSTFYALSGFRAPEEGLALLQAFAFGSGSKEEHELFRRFDKQRNAQGLEEFFVGLFQLSSRDLRSAIERAAGVAQGGSKLRGEAQAVAPWLLRLANLHDSDPGVIASLLLNLVCLAPGEAMFLPAGNLHAYLEGLGLEIMASSDNVMRGGLTSKHVDLSELCKILNFESFVPERTRGTRHQEQGVSITRFMTTAPEFELALIELEEGGTLKVNGPEIWLVLEGEVAALDSGLILKRGEQAFFSAEEVETVRGCATIARASVARVPVEE